MAKDRHLHHIKAFRTTTGVGKPRPSEGSDGDMTIRAIEKGLFLFVKYGNFWYHVSELVTYNPKKVHPHKKSPINTLPGTVQGSGGGSGNVGIKPGSKVILSAINSRTGISGDNYIQSGTTQTSSDLGNAYARNFINFNVGDVGRMLTLDENGSGSRVLLSHSGGALEAKKIYISDSYGSSLGDTHISGTGADELKITVGGESMLHFVESTTNTMESQEIAEYLIRSGTTEDPILHLKNTTNDATGPTLKLNNARAGGGNFGADDDVLGTISFDGEDDAGNAQQYANIKSTIDVAANGQESGELAIQVASHDGGLEDGLVLTGGSVDTEVDVAIGKGTASLSTVAGDMVAVGNINGGLPHIINVGFNYGYAAGTKVYMPLNGYIFESSTLTGRNEYQTFIAPYDGYLEKVIMRCENIANSSIVALHRAANGTELPSAIVGVDYTTTVAMDSANTSYSFDFGASASFDAGDVLAVSFDPYRDVDDTNATIVFRFDTTTNL